MNSSTDMPTPFSLPFPLPPRESALSLLQIAVDSTLRAGVNATQLKTLVDELCANEVDYHQPEEPIAAN